MQADLAPASESGAGDSLERRLRAIVGPAHIAVGAAIEPRYRTDASGHHAAVPAFVLRPADAGQITAILREAARRNCPVTAQGGRTGLVGGAVASAGGIALSLERMDRVRAIDPLSMTMTVDAGVTVQRAQEAAEAHGLMLPLDLGSRGSATIGGTIATCAGGLRVLRWGTMREMVLGLDAVLADGTAIGCDVRSVKDNAGYHWKDLLIGSEGTLAIVTGATLRLRPMPASVQTALVAADGFPALAALLRQLDAELAGTLTSFELMWPPFYDHVSTTNLPKRARPLPLGAGCYAIVEAMGAEAGHDAARFEAALGRALEAGGVTDVVIAQSERERANIWSLREDQGEAFRRIQPYVLFDVSMALADMPHFVDAAEQAVRARFPAALTLFYGHAGDGNLHIVVHVGPECGATAEHDIHVAVFGALRDVGGSISAEHGIGLAKRDYLGWARSHAEIALMRRLKHAFDPQGILNPGKVIDMGAAHG